MIGSGSDKYHKRGLFPFQGQNKVGKWDQIDQDGSRLDFGDEHTMKYIDAIA